MKIYSITPDVEQYQQLCYDEKEFTARLSELSFNGDAKLKNWKPPHVQWIEGPPEGSARKKGYIKPDVAYLAGDLALNSKAIKQLKPGLITEAEFLPITVDGEEWAILNVINMQDVIDVANSRYKIRPDGKVGRMLKMALDTTRLTNAKLFRPVGKPARIFTSDTPGSFKKLVEQGRLSGLLFEAF
jgi:hypothetical protein